MLLPQHMWSISILDLPPVRFDHELPGDIFPELVSVETQKIGDLR
jgi:hypothetical protein